MRTPGKILIAVLAAGVVGSGCNEGDQARVYTAPKDAPREVPVPDDPGPAAAGGPEWVVPAGWTALPASQMRFATFLVEEGPPKLHLVVYVFGPEAGDLLANVNRWEDQIGAPVSAEADLPKVVTRVRSHGLEIDAVDLSGPAAAGATEGQRMLAAIFPHDGQCWFLKLVGPASRVTAHKADYDAFLRSIRFDGQAPVPDGGGEVALGDWILPEGWIHDPAPRSLRAATFFTGSGDPRAEVIVSSIAGDAAGTFEANVNRWRGQVGLEPAADAAATPRRAVKVGAVEGFLLEFTGPAAKSALVAQAVMGRSVWYVKLIGPSDVVAAQGPAFERFLESLAFVRAGK